MLCAANQDLLSGCQNHSFFSTVSQLLQISTQIQGELPWWVVWVNERDDVY